MRIRLDFVSNSSSSSFVVLADENTPAIFKDSSLTLDDFGNRFFARDVMGSLRADIVFFCADSLDNVFSKITYVSPRQFASEYVKKQFASEYKSEGKYLVLKADRPLVGRLRTLAERYVALERPVVKVYRRGENDANLQDAVVEAIHGAQSAYMDAMQAIFDKMTGHMWDAVKNKMSGWKFWHVELDDWREEEGRYGLRDVKWGRVFSNH